jgi:BlaI family transcriptional regulator, penicillinase repressor
MARKTSAALTDGEARVMAVLWRLKSATVADVVTSLKSQYALTYSTIQTTLRILEQKGYVAHEKVARAFVFRPVVDERQARRRALKHLIGRLFNGSPSLLVSNVLDDDDIDPAELARLKKMIEHA